EAFLSWRGHADEQAIGATGLDIRDDIALLLTGEVTVLQPSKDKRRIFVAHAPRRLLQDSGSGSQEIRAEPVLRAYLEQFTQQVHASDARPRRETKRSRAPNDSHPVDTDDVATGDISGEHRIGPHIDKLRDIQGDMPQPFTTSHGLARDVDGIVHRQDIDG